MSSTAGSADGSYPPAELDRRFYAFTLDRLLAWTIYAAAVYAAYVLFLDDGKTGAGIATIAGTVVVVGLALALGLGLVGATPGKAAVGLRVVDEHTGRPIGVGAALLRTLVLGAATLPTMGMGVATLAWTAVMDRDHQRRGWHDHLARSVVIDVRPAPVEQEDTPERPRQIVNLTAMRLVPSTPTTPQREVPARVRRSRWAAGPTGEPAAAPAASAPAPQVAAVAAAAPAPAVMDHHPAPVLDQPAVPVVADQHPAVRHADPLTDPLGAPPAPARRAAAAAPPVIAAPPGPVASPVATPRHAGPTATAPPASPVPAASRWSVSFDTGDAFVVDGFTLVGRNPEPRPGEPVKRLVALPSQDMSLSKTHAQFQVVPDGALVVMDRGSTNGSILVRGGVTKDLGPGRPATLRDGDVVRFGDRTMRVARHA